MKFSQKDQVLRALEESPGAWVNGWHFLSEMYVTQFHARIFELQEEGYKIESKKFPGERMHSYRLVTEEKQNKLF